MKSSTFQLPEQAVFTSDEAVEYLRLPSIRALNHLVDDRKIIRPAMYRKERLYTRVELDRFLAARTDEYGDLA